LARKILLADDSVTAQNMGRKILADAGYEVIAVNNGSAALKKISEIKPDLVVLDVYMPGYSGLEVCQRLKESHETARIPVLLTVGKLEPFKPEEAQRVRAEAFIVKPFEASELLSALSKLEDKVVPRAEPSRPGRFARAFAAVDESARVRPGEENGWKSRISFPHEKTEAEKKAENSEQPDFYNPINRDLRTIVETPQEKAHEVAHGRDEEDKRESSARQNDTVDVAALAPSSVPLSGLPNDVTQEEVAAITAAAAQIQVATAATEEEQRGSETASQGDPQTAGEARETVETIGFEPAIREIDLEAAAPRIVEPPAAASEQKSTDIQDSKTPDLQDSKETQDVPVTMAAAADTVASGASRWTAVAVALENDEAGLLLEHEMQKASAASEVSRADTASLAGVVPERPAEAAEITAERAVPRIPEQFATEPEFASPTLDGAKPAAEAAAPVASSADFEQRSDYARPERAPVQPIEMADGAQSAQSVPVAEGAEETKVAHKLAEAGQATANEFASQLPAASNFSAAAEQEAGGGFSAADYSAVAQEGQPEPVAETTEVTSDYPGSHIASSAAGLAIESEREAQTAPAFDNETVKSTAAAWASWREIHDGGQAAESESDRAKESDVPEPTAKEANAAAAAAGAGQSSTSSANLDLPENGNSSDVASIVDSVLADLRPKLMKEISRKMAEKK
jgi:CheY-like chemotaxis protein